MIFFSPVSLLEWQREWILPRSAVWYYFLPWTHSRISDPAWFIWPRWMGINSGASSVRAGDIRHTGFLMWGTQDSWCIYVLSRGFIGQGRRVTKLSATKGSRHFQHIFFVGVMCPWRRQDFVWPISVKFIGWGVGRLDSCSTPIILPGHMHALAKWL